MTHDTGFAPNPFWGFCTLANCTPNHKPANLWGEDFIIGVEGLSLAKERRQRGYKTHIEQSLVYVMKVEEKLDLDSYFRDPRFQEKKFKKTDDWRKRRGDNVYYQENCKFKWIRDHDHEGKDTKLKFVNCAAIQNDFKKLRKGYGVIAQDLKGDVVFISLKFMYFGDLCIPFEKRLLPLLPPGQSFKYSYDGDGLLEKFKDTIKKLQNKYSYGRHGNPIHWHLKSKIGKKNSRNSSCRKNR